MVDKTMMGDKCAELVRAAMIGALAVTLGNPTAVYAAEEETADPGQIGIEDHASIPLIVSSSRKRRH